MSFLTLARCQLPTKMYETDEGMEQRVFSKIEYGKKVELKYAVIVDVRSRFEHEMSRAPRSFYAFWKDWDLSGYTGARLENKKNELQRLLALKGVDPLTQVVVLGNGLAGKGEEFLVASTLLSLGIERISFMNSKQVKDALVARNLPKLENTPYWKVPLKYNFHCPLPIGKSKSNAVKRADVLITKAGKKSALKPFEVFSHNLKVKKRSYPKIMRPRLSSPNSLWAYGLALYFKDQGRQPCVL